MRLWLVIYLVPVLVFPYGLSADISPSTGGAPSGRPPAGDVQVRDAESFYDDFFQDLPQELEIAAEEGKIGVLVMYQMKDCPFCKRMKETVLNRSDVQDYFKDHFRVVSLDTEGDLEIMDFDGNTTIEKDFALKQNRVRATPVFQVYGLDGKALKNGRLTGATRDADEFLLFGRYLVEGHHNQVSFTRFKRDQATLQRNGRDS